MSLDGCDISMQTLDSKHLYTKLSIFTGITLKYHYTSLYSDPTRPLSHRNDADGHLRLCLWILKDAL